MGYINLLEGTNGNIYFNQNGKIPPLVPYMTLNDGRSQQLYHLAYSCKLYYTLVKFIFA
jgi:hypothetical protein